MRGGSWTPLTGASSNPRGYAGSWSVAFGESSWVERNGCLSPRFGVRNADNSNHLRRRRLANKGVNCSVHQGVNAYSLSYSSGYSRAYASTRCLSGSPNETNPDHRRARPVLHLERHRPEPERTAAQDDGRGTADSTAGSGTDPRADRRRHHRAPADLRR